MNIDQIFAQVILKHSRGMFMLVYNSQMAAHAMQNAAQVADKHQSRKLQMALGILGEAYNHLSQGLIEASGWTPEQLGSCEQDILVVFQEMEATRLVGADGETLQ